MNQTIPNLVSTIIPVFNRPAMLQRAVDSVLAQTWRPIEIIICDDGSTDGTPELGRRLAAEHPAIIRYLWNPNRGAGPAREAGRQRAQGEFIQYLDSDDTLWPRKFEAQIKALRERPECGIAYGQIRFCREGEPPSTTAYKWSGRELPTLFPWILADRWWNTDTPLWRRSVCDAIGPWSDLRYSQDWEYDARAGALGVKLVHVPEFVTDQHHHAKERQTGHGRWLSPEDQVRFFRSLAQQAKQAGVRPEAPEMLHFVRWVLSHSRKCAQQGFPLEAEDLYGLCLELSAKPAPSALVYGALAKVVGWQRSANTLERLRATLSRRAGAETLKQSWQ